MQRNYLRMSSPADDQDKDGFKFENVGPTHLNSVVLHFVQPFVLESLLIFLF